jgi:hypothetical protein
MGACANGIKFRRVLRDYIYLREHPVKRRFVRHILKSAESANVAELVDGMTLAARDIADVVDIASLRMVSDRLVFRPRLRI